MKFTAPFKGVPDGEIYPRDYEPGEDCPPELEHAAREAGALAEGHGPEEKADLIAKLEAAGITFDKRWGVDKLAAALAEGKKD